MSDFDTLRDAINTEWIKRYGGEPVSAPAALANRVRQLGLDRDCWVTTANATEKARRAAEEKLSKAALA